MSGGLGILNVGAGDTKLTFDKNNPVERERAAKIVTDMLKRGYAILIQVGAHKGEPSYVRAKGFDPDTCEYIIAGGPEESVDIGSEHGKSSEAEAGSPAGSSGGVDGGTAKRGRGRPRRVPAESVHGVAVARTSGG